MIASRIPLVACALGLATFAGSGTAQALENPFPDNVIVAPGVKLGYTFGSGGGSHFGGIGHDHHH